MRSLPMLCVLSAATLLVRATPAAAQECFVVHPWFLIKPFDDGSKTLPPS
ncbi:MAG: hypothetical protein JWM41_485 [Gemmatimonadetes bacterium]|nr:hypothetical protein [Gemmatimonadota bacterium]